MEYFEFEANESPKMSVIFEIKGENLIVKLPFQLPYHTKSASFDETNEVVMFQGAFFRSDAKVFENDTLYTTFHKESLSRQNVMELMAQMNVNYDEDNMSLPLKTINSFLKNISKDFYQISSSHTVFLWNESTKTNNSVVSAHFLASPLIGSQGPPPKFS